MAASITSIKRLASDSVTSQIAKKQRSDDKSPLDSLNEIWKYRTVWYNEHQQDPIEYYKVAQRWRRGVVDYLECFNNMEQCREYIQSLANTDTYVILIVTDLPDQTNLLDIVSAIYIHQTELVNCSKLNKDTNESSNRRKIKGIYNNVEELLTLVAQEVLLLSRQNFVSAPDLISTSSSDISERSSCSKYRSIDDYFYCFLDSLMETDSSSSGKQKFVEECRRTYANDKAILRILDEFDRTYTPNRAVYWYTRTGFLYTLVNQALSQQNNEALLLLHFFLRDIDQQLLLGMDETNENDWEGQMDLYRGQRMSLDEIEELKTTNYTKAFFYSFLSTTTDIDVARMFSGAGQISKDDSVQPVLFHFNCGDLKRLRGVANIRRLSDNEAEEEILFSPLYTFSVLHVQYDEDEQVWKIECGMDGDVNSLPLLLHQRLIKLDIALRILTTNSSSEEDSNTETCSVFIQNMLIFINEIFIPDGNIVTLDEDAQVKKNTKHAVTALFLLKGLKSFNENSLAHQPHIPLEMLVTLWDCFAVMYKEKRQFQKAIDYFEKADGYNIPNESANVARKINVAQVHRMMNHYDQAWSIYQDLLDAHINKPDADDYNVFCEIATDIPYVDSESSMTVWYSNIFGYMEYIYNHCCKTSDDKSMFYDQLIERYEQLGHGYWYLAHDKQQALVCYNRWRELLEASDQPLGQVLMYLAHTCFIDDPVQAKSLYEQAIVELAIDEMRWTVPLAVSYSRLGYMQKNKRFFTRCFYLLVYVEDLSRLHRQYLEEIGECYLYLAKYYDEIDSRTSKNNSKAIEYYEQALSLFLNVKPPTSNFREMVESADLLFHHIKENQDTTKQDLMLKLYDEPPITSEQLENVLKTTLSKIFLKKSNTDDTLNHIQTMVDFLETE